MTDIINNLFNFINNFFVETNEPFKNTDNFGVSFFEDDDGKNYQRLLDSELVPAFIYKGKGYKVQKIKIIPKDMGKFNFTTSYKLGSIVKFKGKFYMALPVPNPKKKGDAKFTNFLKNIIPTKKFGDYVAWKHIMYLTKPKTYTENDLFPKADIPEEVNEGTILDDSNPRKKIKIIVKGMYNPFLSYKVGDLVKFNEKIYVNLLLKADKQEDPSKNKQTWKLVTFNGIMSDDYIPAKKVPSRVFEGEMILPNTVAKKIRQEYKGRMKGEYDSEEKYKLGDIVKFKNKYYISLVKGRGFLLDQPNENKQHWKLVKLIKGKQDEDDDKPKRKFWRKKHNRRKRKEEEDDEEEDDEDKPKRKSKKKEEEDDEDEEEDEEEDKPKRKSKKKEEEDDEEEDEDKPTRKSKKKEEDGESTDDEEPVNDDQNTEESDDETSE
jgi:hypothetical protein